MGVVQGALETVSWRSAITMIGLVSIVIPTFNRARYLRDALDSIFAQTMRDFEVIIIDDGSTDDTKDVVKQYRSEIRYIFQENSGRGAARNRGVAEARGEYLAFLDSDDIWYPDHLQRQLDYLKRRPGTVFLHGLVDAIREDGTRDVGESSRVAQLFAKAHRKMFTYEHLLDSCLIFSSTVLVSRKVLEEVGGFDPKLRTLEDLDLYLRVARAARIDYLEGAPLASYRHHDGNAYNEAGDKAILETYKEIFLRNAIGGKSGVEDPKALAQAHISISFCYAGLGEKNLCRKHILHAMTIYPAKVFRPYVIARFFKSFM